MWVWATFLITCLSNCRESGTSATPGAFTTSSAQSSTAATAPVALAPFPQRAYVWQRDWKAPVAAGLMEGREVLDGTVVLGAEVEWGSDGPRVVKPRVDWPALKTFGKPVSVAMRIAPSPGPFSDIGPVTEKLCAIAGEVIDDAKSGGVPLAEFQLDFDCAQKKLAGYALWVRAIRRAVEPVPLVITTLPSWLPEPDFPGLVREAGAYVLQVHSVASPRGDEKTRICDPDEARRWVAQAAKLGLPYEIALPTYRSVVGYSPEGRLLGVASDAVRPTWPPGTLIREYATDAEGMAALVAEWQQQRPAHCRGLMWYRLPVATDANNWRWPTLRAVMQGRAPRDSWRLRVDGAATSAGATAPSESGAQTQTPETAAPNPADFILVNDGETDGPPDCRIVVRWEGGARATCDALPGWETTVGTGQVTFVRATANQRRLPPGEECAIGWLRLEPGAPLHVEILR